MPTAIAIAILAVVGWFVLKPRAKEEPNEPKCDAAAVKRYLVDVSMGRVSPVDAEARASELALLGCTKEAAAIRDILGLRRLGPQVAAAGLSVGAASTASSDDDDDYGPPWARRSA